MKGKLKPVSLHLPWPVLALESPALGAPCGCYFPEPLASDFSERPHHHNPLFSSQSRGTSHFPGQAPARAANQEKPQSLTAATSLHWQNAGAKTPSFYRRALTNLGFSGGSDRKESACNAGDLALIPGLGRSPGEGNGNPLQYSCLENPMDRGAWQAAVQGLKESDTIEPLTTRKFI